MAAATLDNVVNQLLINNKKQQDTTDAVQSSNSLLRKFMDEQKLQKMKDLEAQREMMKKLAAGSTFGGKPTESTSDKKKGGKGFQFPDWAKTLAGGLGLVGLAKIMGSLLKNLKFLSAGLIAIELASWGFRGWEAGALKKLTALTGKGLNSIGTKIAGYIDDTVRAGLKFIGISEDVGGVAKSGRIYTKMNFADGKFASKELASTKEMLRRLFGTSDDPKIKANKGPGGMFSKMRNIIGMLFSPIASFIKAATNVGKTFLAPFASVAKFLGVTTLAGLSALGFAKFAPMIGKILWPVGVLFSLWESIKSWQDGNPERSTRKKITDAISVFVGNFVGAPLDLLKGGFTWLLKKAFGLETDEDGKVLPGQGFGGVIVSKMQEFSFETFITDTLQSWYDLGAKVLSELWSFAKNPKEYVNNYLETQGVSSVGELIQKSLKSLFEIMFGWIPTPEEIQASLFKMASKYVHKSLWWMIPGMEAWHEDNKAGMSLPERKALALEQEKDRLAAEEMDLRARNAGLFKMLQVADKSGDGKLDMAELEAFKEVQKGQLDFTATNKGTSLGNLLKEIYPESIMNKRDMVEALVTALQDRGTGGNIAVQNLQQGSDTSLLFMGGTVDTNNPSDKFIDIMHPFRQ